MKMNERKKKQLNMRKWLSKYIDSALYYSFSIIQLFLFSFLHFHILYEVESIYLLVRFLLFSYFFFLSFIFIYYTKWSQSICLFAFYYSAISSSFPSFSYIIWSRVNLFACSFLLFSYFFFLSFIFIYNMKLKERKRNSRMQETE